MSFKKPKVPNKLPEELSCVIGDFFGMSGAKSVKGYLQIYRDAQRLTLAARNEFMTQDILRGSNVTNTLLRLRWQTAYAKECKARNQLKLVLQR